MRAVVLLAVAVLFVSMEAHPRVGRDTHSRGCQYINGRCYRECPEGTHSYTVGCAQVQTERTCESPVSHTREGIICDLSRCECDEPNVKDTSTGECVPLDSCPKSTGEPAKEIAGVLAQTPVPQTPIPQPTAGADRV